mmetsp:Transcript_48745/g.87807  ORF Transcript_48745/g.87807 Transcript_48745/m.87807 type:complete len:121 (+) Transcript_48745:1266-1628(+)
MFGLLGHTARDVSVPKLLAARMGDPKTVVKLHLARRIRNTGSPAGKIAVQILGASEATLMNLGGNLAIGNARNVATMSFALARDVHAATQRRVRKAHVKRPYRQAGIAGVKAGKMQTQLL